MAGRGQADERMHGRAGLLALSPARPLALLALLALLAACTASERDAHPAEDDLEARPEQESWGVDLALSFGGRPRARIEAPYLARFETADSTYTRFGPADEADTARVTVEVFDAEGQPSAHVRADRLLYHDRQRRFVAEGRVRVETPTGKTLRTEELVWDEAARRLRSERFVQITAPEERIEGYRLEASEDLDTYSLARITGQVTVED